MIAHIVIILVFAGKKKKQADIKTCLTWVRETACVSLVFMKSFLENLLMHVFIIIKTSHV